MARRFPSPPACADDADCRLAFPSALVVCDAGACACDSAFALLGPPDCLADSPASLGTRAALGVAAGLVFVTIARFLPNLVRAVGYRRWTNDPAGVSFVLSWLALVFLFMASGGRFAQAFAWTPGLAYFTTAAYIATVSTVLPAVLLMEATFVDATRIVPKFNSRAKTREIVGVPLVAMVAVGIVLSAVLPQRDLAWNLALGVIFSFLTAISIAAPSYLYVRMAHLLFLNNHRKEPPIYVLVNAIISEVLCGTRAMKRAMGLYDVDSDSDEFGSKHSKGEGQQRETIKDHVSKRLSKLLRPPSRLDVAPQTGKEDIILNPTASSKNVLTAAAGPGGEPPPDFPESSKLRKFFLGSKDANQTFLNKQRDENSIRFLSRATRMSFNLALSLLSFSSFSLAIFVWGMVQPPVDQSLDVSRIAVFYAAAEISLCLGIYRLLWFLNKKYRLKNKETVGFKTISREGSRVGSRLGSRENVLLAAEARTSSRENVLANSRPGSRDDLSRPGSRDDMRGSRDDEVIGHTAASSFQKNADDEVVERVDHDVDLIDSALIVKAAE